MPEVSIAEASQTNREAINSQMARGLGRIGEISKTLDTAPPGPEPEDTSRRREVTKKRDALKSAGISTSAANRYEEIASLPEKAFEAFIAQKAQKKQPAHASDAIKAVKNKVRREKAEEEKGAHRTDSVSDLAALAESGQQFKAIYADPPWTFKVYSGKGKSRSAETHYDSN